jgi:ElaB/YqjD/DUF883 family membrane-anchored ribosome-binding protein
MLACDFSHCRCWLRVAKCRDVGDVARERTMIMEATKRGDSQKTLQDLGDAVQEGEEMLSEVAGTTTEKGRAMRAKLESAVERAKALYGDLQERTIAAAKAADQSVREHPYQAIGIAFGIGLLIGVLAARSRRD